MGGGDASELRFDQASVDKITKGLRSAIGELGKIGDGTGSLMGKGFSELSMTGMEAGHHGLSVDFEDFCERWDWGVRTLIHDGSQIAERLGLSAGTQWAEDQYVQGSLKVITNSVIGDPHASEEDVENNSWGHIIAADKPDFGGWGKAGDEMAQTWKDTGREVLTTGKGGQLADVGNDLFGISDKEYDDALDRAFGPSPEERAKQQGQDGGG